MLNSARITFASDLVPFVGPQSGVTDTPAGQVDYVRRQFDPQGSSSYLVWNEKNESTSPEVDDLFDSYDIEGMNLSTGALIKVATWSGNQMEPAISGSWVVWADNSQSCKTCERDIAGKNLDTGAKVTIASGPADQSMPGISGTTVAWIDSYSETEKLMVGNIIGLGAPFALTTVTNTDANTLGQPALSDSYIVWSEMVQSATTNPSNPTALPEITSTTTLKAYNRNTSAITVITQNDVSSIEYAVSGNRVVWSDNGLHLTDLSTMQDSLLFDLSGSTPSISGNIVLWSATSGVESKGLDIWGEDLSLSNPSPILLVTEDGNQLGAVIAGDKLTWQTDGPSTDSPAHGRISTTSLSGAFASPPPQPQLPLTGPTPGQDVDTSVAPPPPPMPTTDPPAPTPGAVYDTNGILITSPTKKGIHAPNGSGWGVPNALNALADTTHNAPYFGSVVVLETDLNQPSHGSGTWGPYVKNAMQTLRNDGKEVIVRSRAATSSTGCLPPTQTIFQPNFCGTSSPHQDSDLILNDLAWRNWMSRIQMENEPDNEWNSSCNSFWGCWWPERSGQFYVWANRNDPIFYQAINDWYKDAGGFVWAYTNNCNPNTDATCYNLEHRISLWTPPMDPGLGYHLLSNRQNRYDLLAGMIGRFHCTYTQITTKCFSYHAYPAPSIHDSHGDGLRNNTWDWFNADVQARINDGRTRSQVTEFGWDPTLMDRNHCQKTQQMSWGPTPTPAIANCGAKDGYTHTFAGDISTFESLDGFRHKAETIAVWITSGWFDDFGDDRANGLNPDGSLRNWFSTYQQSAP
jgi:hypothetical protein